MVTLTPEEQRQLQAEVTQRYPALASLLAKCQHPERDTLILHLALVYEQPPDEIARQVNLSTTVVRHVIAAAQRYLHEQEEPPATERVETGETPRETRRETRRETERETEPLSPVGPHVESELLGILLGYVPSNPIIHQQLARHLVRCEQCQIALGTMLGSLTMGAGSPDPVRARGERILLQLQTIIHKLRSSEKRGTKEAEPGPARRRRALARRRGPAPTRPEPRLL